MAHDSPSTLKTFKTASGKTGRFYSLPALAKQFPNVSRLPVSHAHRARDRCCATATARR